MYQLIMGHSPGALVDSLEKDSHLMPRNMYHRYDLFPLGLAEEILRQDYCLEPPDLSSHITQAVLQSNYACIFS